jgi:hypothetical protein
MDLLELWEQMGLAVKSLMGILALMSMWSMGVFFERVFTFFQATKQPKLFAPQVAKHLKDGRLKECEDPLKENTHRPHGHQRQNSHKGFHGEPHLFPKFQKIHCASYLRSVCPFVSSSRVTPPDSLSRFVFLPNATGSSRSPS